MGLKMHFMLHVATQNWKKYVTNATNMVIHWIRWIRWIRLIRLIQWSHWIQWGPWSHYTEVTEATKATEAAESAESAESVLSATNFLTYTKQEVHYLLGLKMHFMLHVVTHNWKKYVTNATNMVIRWIRWIH
jgi:hypothetical protein